MVNQYVWIGIVVGIFFVGIGIGYSIQSNTLTVPMMMNTQQMQQMMAQQAQGAVPGKKPKENTKTPIKEESDVNVG